MITNVNKNNSIKINSKDKTGNLTEKIKIKSESTLYGVSSYTIITNTDNRNWIGDNFKLVSDGSFWYLTENTWNEIDYTLSIGTGNTDNNLLTGLETTSLRKR